MVAKVVAFLKKALKYVKLAALYIPQVIGLLEKKPEELTKDKE